MEDKIQAFRQPMVTAAGILLGFLLNYAAGAAKADTPLGDGLAYFSGLCVLAGTVSLIMVLFRALKMDYPREDAARYYRGTLGLFTGGIVIAFVGVFIDMFAHFMS